MIESAGGPTPSHSQLTEQPAEPQAELPVSPPEPPANPNIPKLQSLIQSFNISVDQLPPDLKEQYEELVAKDLTPEEYKKSIIGFMNGIKTRTELDLSKDALHNLDDTINLFSSNQITPEQITQAIKGYINGETVGLSPEQRSQANQALNELSEETKKPEGERNQEVIKEKTSTLMRILKSLGAIIMALLGFSIWRGFKEAQAAPQR